MTYLSQELEVLWYLETKYLRFIIEYWPYSEVLFAEALVSLFKVMLVAGLFSTFVLCQFQFLQHF